MHLYLVKTVGWQYQVIAFNKYHAIVKAYFSYKKYRNTSFKRFKMKIESVKKVKY